MNLPILYEDKNYVVINKPPGLVVHSDGKTKEPTVTDWVLEHYPETQGVGEPIQLTKGGVIDRPGIVHRIDRETSGALIIAKTQEAHAHLKEQFQNREVIKTYRAFLHNNLKTDEGVIDRPIGRSRNDFRKYSTQMSARGEMREAITHYRVLLRTKDFTYVEANPKTGRTHQIRVHFTALNHPVICDKLYAPNRDCALGFGRVALHALSVEFTNLEGKKVKVEAPLPEDFKNAEKILEQDAV